MNIFSVTQFVDFVNTAFTSAVFPDGVTIEGEVVEYRVSQDRWIWFVLKDETAVISCFATVWQLRTPLEDGMRVRVFGVPKIYPKSGKFSVTVERVELVGEGALRRAFELLKKKLEIEGLFALDRKRTVPRFPERVGLIASKESAAYTDFLRILGNRWGGLTISLTSVAVQGREAVSEIVGAFSYFNAHPELADVLVLTRGGGSLEDLQAFNSEEVARAVFGSRIPVIVGVGHERDESLADYVADIRASTPSNAAEMLTPDRREVVAFIDGGMRHVDIAMRAALMTKRDAVSAITAQIESYARRSITVFLHQLKDFRRHFAVFSERLHAKQVACEGFHVQLFSAAAAWSDRLTRRLEADTRLLKTLDPRRPLEKGYALVTKGGRVVKDAGQVDVHETVDIQLFRGGLRTEVKEIL